MRNSIDQLLRLIFVLLIGVCLGTTVTTASVSTGHERTNPVGFAYAANSRLELDCDGAPDFIPFKREIQLTDIRPALVIFAKFLAADMGANVLRVRHLYLYDDLANFLFEQEI